MMYVRTPMVVRHHCPNNDDDEIPWIQYDMQ